MKSLPLFRKKYIDFSLLAIVLALTLLGLLVLSSAVRTQPGGGSSFLLRQGVASALGLVTMVVLMVVDYRLWKRNYLLLYGLSILFLLATLVFGHGESTWGARSWLSLGPITFQPSEIVKVWLIIALAAWLEAHEERINKPLVLGKTLLFAGFPVGLILLQPDFGTAMVFLFFIAIMLYFAEIDWKYIFAAMGAGLVSLPVLYLRLDNYQKDRIFDFLHPEENISGSGYQAYEGRIAIGSGKFFGRGLYKGPQTQFNFIPTKETDFIFPVLVEELGFVGGFFLLILYLGLFYRLYHMGEISSDKSGRYMSMGILAVFLIHIWENIGMTLGLMPVTGIPLPFISYGGSFQLVNFAMIGLALSVRYHRMNRRKEREVYPLEDWLEKHWHSVLEYWDKKIEEERQKRFQRRK
ncbi:MAG: rod shape-determining protein RodA [Tissierellia bacterium]|nr:rod shape-determining protein RodA [Tissierellia bacterium]